MEERFLTEAPSPQTILEIFHGDWSSAMPDYTGLKAVPGFAQLFEDGRITWCNEKMGPVFGMNVLELGPLEGAHTAMLHNLGAASITAIEMNSRAFLKCLCVKEIFGLTRARFLHGNFVPFLEKSETRYDLTVASGVLYHMTDPVHTLRLICRSSDRILLWTHYYDSDITAKRDDASLFATPTEEDNDGIRIVAAKRGYSDAALQWKGFSGGSAPYAIWLGRNTILDILRSEGLSEIAINFDAPDHPNGPAFAVCASRIAKTVQIDAEQ